MYQTLLQTVAIVFDLHVWLSIVFQLRLVKTRAVTEESICYGDHLRHDSNWKITNNKTLLGGGRGYCALRVLAVLNCAL